VRSKLLIEIAARKDIEAYKNRHGVAEVAFFATMTADNYANKFESEGEQ